MKIFFVLFFTAGLAFSFLYPEKSFTIYTIGDSTMANKKPEVYPETGWCQVLDRFFESSVTVSNHAVNGRSTKSFIDEGRWQKVLGSLKSGDYVFIQFGHNDEKSQDSSRYTTPYGTYSENLSRFIKESRSKGAVPVLFTPIIRRKFSSEGKLMPTHGDYPDAVRKVAATFDVPLIDLETLTGRWVSDLGDHASKEMFLHTPPDEKYPEGRKDDTHLSVKGATEVARLAMQESRVLKLAFSERLINE